MQTNHPTSPTDLLRPIPVDVVAHQYTIQEIVSQETLGMMHSAELTSFWDDRVRGLVLLLKAYAVKNSITGDLESAELVPLTWWDAFKMAHFPAWALKRYPARQRSIIKTWHHHHVCPHMAVDFTHDSHVRFLAFEGVDYTA